MIVLAHLADLHLDTPFSALSPSDAAVRRQELKETFAAAVAYAVSTGARLMLLCGDLFDNEYAGGQTAAFLARIMGEVPDIRFFIAPGNHDYLSAHSVYRTTAFPENVHIFGGGMERVDIPGTDVTVYGFGATAPQCLERPLSGFRVTDAGRINIMAAHMTLTTSPHKELYTPVTAEDIARSGLTYLALGHIHSFSGIQRTGRTFYAYPGCPEGRGFDECGPKGMIAGTVDKTGCALSFVPLQRRSYETVTADLSGVSDHYEAKARIAAALKELSLSSLVRVVLSGRVKGDYLPEPAVLAEACGGFFYAEITDSTSAGPELSELASERTLKGLFVRRMMEIIEKAADGEEKRLADRALRFGLKALADEEVPCLED